jgi:hypothetical protein
MDYIEDLTGKRQGRGRPRASRSFARKQDAERFLRHAEADKLR